MNTRRCLTKLCVFICSFGFACAGEEGPENDTNSQDPSYPPTSGGGTGDWGSETDPQASGGTNSPSTGGNAPAPGSGGAQEPGPCDARVGELAPEILSIAVTDVDGGAPDKGDQLAFTLVLRNLGSGVGPLTVRARIESARFSDFVSVPVGSLEGQLCAGETTFRLEAGPFLDDEESGKHFALGSGDYTVTSVDFLAPNLDVSHPTEIPFTVASSNALLVPVIYDQGYFEAIPGLTTNTPEDYLRQQFQRPAQIFTPDSMTDPDGAGSFIDYPGGFDEMMNVRHMFRVFPGFPGETTTDEGWCEDATFYAQNTLGLATPWQTSPQETRPERHGFDYLLALSPGLGGGVACGWIDVQVSGLIGNDLDRQQIVSVHETAHIFGAPHCDDLGNGSGGPLQNYVMCSGEKHANYPESFVFHSASRAKMSSKWN